MLIAVKSMLLESSCTDFLTKEALMQPSSREEFDEGEKLCRRASSIPLGIVVEAAEEELLLHLGYCSVLLLVDSHERRAEKMLQYSDKAVLRSRAIQLNAVDPTSTN